MFFEQGGGGSRGGSSTGYSDSRSHGSGGGGGGKYSSQGGGGSGSSSYGQGGSYQGTSHLSISRITRTIFSIFCPYPEEFFGCNIVQEFLDCPSIRHHIYPIYSVRKLIVSLYNEIQLHKLSFVLIPIR